MANLKDSGSRREFETGAVRDMAEGKGRCDLLPLSVCSILLNDAMGMEENIPDHVLPSLAAFQKTGHIPYLYKALLDFTRLFFVNEPQMLLEVAIHFEDGARKYGDNNWRKGIECSVYIDSAVRHYLKLLAKMDDEPHARAVAWNLLCCIWTAENMSELKLYRKEE